MAAGPETSGSYRGVSAAAGNCHTQKGPGLCLAVAFTAVAFTEMEGLVCHGCYCFHCWQTVPVLSEYAVSSARHSTAASF